MCEKVIKIVQWNKCHLDTDLNNKAISLAKVLDYH